MKEKNKKLIMIVSVLLLFGGISLAYFASQVLSSGTGSNTKGTTASINGATVTVTGNLEFNDTSIYPGHRNVSSIKVTATGDNELIPYNLIWTGTNSLNTPLNYTIYKTSSNIDVNATCEKKTKIENGAQILKEECNISNIESLGTEIASGTISTSTTETKVTLATDEFITATNDGDTKYYYVILEYPNLEASQNEDIGGTFTGKVNVEASSTEPDINILAAYIEQEDGTYQESKDIPQSGYTLNTSKSTCSNGATPSGSVPNITINNLTKSGTSCYLYFDIKKNDCKGTTCETILASKTISTRTDFSTTLTTDTTGTIYTAEDDYGTSYYFAGNPTDNWVKFAGMYWRIIRINGDGTIRMIYQGTAANTTGTGTQTTTSAFNSSYNKNMYVGYMYTSGQVHGTGTASTIKGVLDSWYNSNLASYASYIATGSGATFCNDRTPYSGSGTGTTYTEYAVYNRLIYNKTPSFKCADSGDRFSTSIGLITADEVLYAGGVYGTSNSSYYLYTGQYYWTMSPYFFRDGKANVFVVWSGGQFSCDSVNWTEPGVRPVINLKADTQFAQSGTGTAENPYVVS